MRSCHPILSLAIILLMAACQPATEPETTAQQPAAPDMEARIQEYTAALASGDAAALAAMFADDAIMMPPNAKALAGKQAIQDMWAANFEKATYKATIAAAESEVAGGWMYGRGTYTTTVTPKAGGEAIEDTGKWMSISKSMPDGTWKIYRHIWNSDNPLPVPES